MGINSEVLGVGIECMTERCRLGDSYTHSSRLNQTPQGAGASAAILIRHMFRSESIHQVRYRLSVFHCLFLASQFLKSGATWLEADHVGKLIACMIFQAIIIILILILILGLLPDVSQEPDIIKAMGIGPSE